MNCNVLYWNPSATPELRRIVEGEMPGGWTLRVLGQDGNAAELLPLCDYLIVADRAVTADDLAQAGRLRMIQHQGVGYERIDLDACRRHRVLLGLTPEGTTTGVAEHTILLILGIYKQLLKAAGGVRTGKWLQWELRQSSFELSGKTLGLIGFGRIGRSVAARATAFEANVIYFDPVPQVHPGLAAERTQTLEDLLRRSDIVSLHLPGSASNCELIDGKALALMQPHAILINTSRGNLIDESALYAALTSGRIAGAGLDVLRQEPPSPDNPLLALENTLVTPHISAGTADAFRAKMRAVFENLLRNARGDRSLQVVPELTDLLEETR